VCGIAGILRFSGAPAAEAEVRGMVAALAHRGPDGEGFFAEGGVALGMRRLAVLDLSERGRQPMPTEDGAVQVVLNGEIYNFRDLRSRLVAQGHAFRSRSDTEVLAHGYEAFGAEGLVRRLEGMFAFALLDRRARRVWLARDGFGVKPLYLRRARGQLAFASEIRALAQDGSGPIQADPAFVHSFLRVGFVPSPHTGFASVSKLPPGTLLEVDLAAGEEREHRLHEVRPLAREALGRTPAERLEQLGGTLDLAVRRQLVSDAPLGVFLSGGTDSTAISWLASRRVRGPLRTFSIGFASSDRGDESRAATSVARALGAEAAMVRLGPTSLDDLASIVESLEEPIADSAVVPLWNLCRGTRQRVTVALSGEGGDESLGGYARYYWGWAARRPTAAVAALARAGGLAPWLPGRTHGLLNLVRRARKLHETLHLPETERYLSWFDVFTLEERRSLHPGGEPLVEARMEELFRRAEALGLDGVQRLQYVDLRAFLLDNLLVKSDKLSMAHSLEVRVPLVDRAVVELGLALPPEDKVSPWRGKVLLRRLLRSRFPLASVRPKRGFEIPVDAWFRGRQTAGLEDELARGRLVGSLGFSGRAVRDLFERHRRGEDLGRKLFALLSLELWGRRYA
jgi:asparagine synthase (glutamine-hydrolysing)